MKSAIRGTRRLILSMLLPVIFVLPGSAQTNEGQKADPNAGFFMSHLRKNWDDIHDVVMRFHNEDPGLRGVAMIRMNWQDGALVTAFVDSNDTGNSSFGQALIDAMKKWRIQDMSGAWGASLPFKTVIRGRDDPAFQESAIFTGMIADKSGKPVPGARLILTPGEHRDSKPDTVYTNREGIFIWTLIPPGDWRLECKKDGYLPAIIETLTFEKGKHVKRTLVMDR